VTPTQPGFVFIPLELIVTVVDADVTAAAIGRQQPEDGLGAEAMQRIDAAPESSLPSDSVVLPNGQSLDAYLAARGLPATPAAAAAAAAAAATVPGPRRQALPPATGPQQRKNDLVALMLSAARDYACARRRQPCTKWDYPADPIDPTNKPAQLGLTYVYGGRTPDVRTRPVDGCPQLTHGMDCSGLIIKIAQAAGLTAPPSSGPQSDPARWVIPEDWKLKMKLVTGGRIESGDLVAWPGHIGIAESSGQTANVISSTGLPGQCESNIRAPRGPRSLSIPALGLGQPTAVLRLVTTLSGEFDMYVRCASQSTDAAVIRFTIDNDQGGPFRAVGTGTDYNGSPLSFVLDGTYDQVSNTVDATLSFADGTRRDAFRIKLLEDDTGYFPLTKALDNGGCPASARLVRVATPAAVASARARAAEGPRAGPPSSARLGGPSQPARR